MAGSLEGGLMMSNPSGEGVAGLVRTQEGWRGGTTERERPGGRTETIVE